MKKLALYPFNKELSPIARYADELSGYRLTALISPKSLGFNGIDAGKIDGGGFIGLTVTNHLSDNLPDFDTLLVDYHPHIKNTAFYLDIIKHYVQSGKEILLTRTLAQFLGTVHTQGFTVLGENTVQPIKSYGFDLSGGLYEIDVPVISVLSTGHMTNKFELQLAIRRYFTNKGYKVCQWGTKDYSSLFGFPALPEFITEPALLSDRIICLNHLIHKTVEQEKPDLIIIGAPGSIMKYNRHIVNDFCEPAYVVTNAVRADITCLSLHQLSFNLEYFKNIQNYCLYKFDCDVRYFNIANCRSSFGREKKEMTYLTLETDFVMNQLDNEIMREKNMLVFNVLDENAINHACADMEKQLVNNTALV